MSIFRELTVGCPACGTKAAFDGVFSVNADRRADLRGQILDESFQQTVCVACGTTFRVDPEFAYVNADRGQWIAAMPIVRLGNWQAEEASARLSFDRVYGPSASPAVRAIGRRLKPRLTFGWAGLREKLVVVAHDLDDVAIELCKAAVLRGSEAAPIAADTELRLVDVDAGNRSLVFAWLQSVDEAEIGRVCLERSVYDDVVADVGGGWAEMRASVAAGYFVDLNRLMLAA